MIIADRIPWYMAATAGVGAIGLATGVGTLASAFTPMFGPWAWGAALLLDLLALSLTAWSIQAVREAMPAGAVRAAAHGCVAASVAVQGVTAFQGLAGGTGGWTSAVLHTIPPLVLCLALELIARHYVHLYRARTAPMRAHETLRVQIARAATGLPVDLRACATAVVAAARADVVDVRQLARLISDSDIEEAPAMKALCATVQVDARMNTVNTTHGRVNTTVNTTVNETLEPGPDQVVHSERPIWTRDERRAAVWALKDSSMSVRAIAEQLGVSTGTVSKDIRSRPTVGFTPTK